MKTFTHDKEYEVQINGEWVKLPILVTKKSGACTQSLDTISRQFIAMLTHTDKVFMMRVDLHMRHYTPNNKDLSNLAEDFKSQIRTEYKRKAKTTNRRKTKGQRKVNYDIKHIGMMWCREYEKAEDKRQHYHLFLLFDAHVVDNVWTVSKVIKRMISSTARYHIFASHWVSNTTLTIKRDDLFNLQRAFRWASYLAKERGKGYRDKTANDFSGSRIPINTDKLHLVMPQLNRPELELTLCDPMPTKPKAKPLTKRTTTRRCTKAVNDTQLDLFAVA